MIRSTPRLAVVARFATGLRLAAVPRHAAALSLAACLALSLTACAGHTDDHDTDHSGTPSGTPADTAGSAHADPAPEPAPETSMTTAASDFFALETTTLAGKPAPLSQYAGKVVLVVNVASKCGYTPQYAGLQDLYASHKDRGLVVLGFPSNEFGGQEPGSPEQIQAFCTSNFGVEFPLLGKCEVKSSSGQSPVYSFLEAQTGSVPNWNFCKYLVGRDGQVIAFYESKVAPDSQQLIAAIQAALG